MTTEKYKHRDHVKTRDFNTVGVVVSMVNIDQSYELEKVCKIGKL